MSPSAFWYGSVTARRSRCSPDGLIRTTRRPLRPDTSRAEIGWRNAGPSSDTKRSNNSAGTSSVGLSLGSSTQTRSTGTSGANVSICSTSARYHSCSVRIGT